MKSILRTSSILIFLATVSASTTTFCWAQQNAYNENAYNENAYSENAYSENAYDQHAYDQNAYDQNAYDQNAYNENAHNENGYNENAVELSLGDERQPPRDENIYARGSRRLSREATARNGEAFPVTDHFTATPTADRTRASYVVTNSQMFPEVKNVNFFGIDRDSCCDEWAGLCACKSLKYGCNCGGLKTNKGHLGLTWLKSRFGGEDCDYCNGGCCEKGCKRKGCKHRNKAENTTGSIFGRELKSNCDRCGCCEEGCPPEEGCTSCK